MMQCMWKACLQPPSMGGHSSPGTAHDGQHASKSRRQIPHTSSASATFHRHVATNRAAFTSTRIPLVVPAAAAPDEGAPDPDMEGDGVSAATVIRLSEMQDEVISSAVLHPHITFAVGPHGLGGFARASIPCGAVLASIPHASILNEPYAEATRHGATAIALLRASHAAELTGRTVLYLVMCAERAGSPGCAAPGRFAAYLRALPARYDDPCWWPAHEAAALLRHTNLAHATAHRLSWLRRLHAACFPALSLAEPSLFPPSCFTFGAFMWAHSTFSSRGFPHLLSVPPSPGDGETLPAAAPADVATEDDESVNPFSGGPTTGHVGCMMPVLDVFNHGPRTPITWLRSAEGVSLVASGAAPLSAGAEVLNNYGPKSNEELLLAFGFVLRPNADDTCVLRLRLGDALGAVCAAAAIPSRHVCRLSGLPASLLAAVRVATLSPRQVEVALRMIETDGGSSLACVLHVPGCAAAEVRALLAVRALLENKLEVLRTAHEWLREGEGGEATNICDVGDVPGSAASSMLQPGGAAIETIEAPSTDQCADAAIVVTADAWPPPVEPRVAAHRVGMAREFVAGQARVLAACIADARARLAALLEGPPSPSLPPPAPHALPSLASLPGVRGTLFRSAGEAGVTAEWHCPPSSSPALIVPAQFLLCATNGAAIAPRVAAALEAVEGLALPSDAEDWDVDTCMNTSRTHAVLLLMAERHRVESEGAAGVSALPSKKRARATSDATEAAWLGVRRGFVEWAVRVFSPPPPLDRTVESWRAMPIRHDSFEELFPLLSDSFPRAFPPTAFSHHRWAWASRVVDASAVPVRVADKLQLVLPLLFPLLPTVGCVESGESSRALAAADPSLGAPLGSWWRAVRDESNDDTIGRGVTCGDAIGLCAPRGGLLRVNPGVLADDEGGAAACVRGPFCTILSLSVPLAVCALLEAQEQVSEDES